MKEKIEILLFGLFVVWLVLIPMIMIKRIEFYKTLRHKHFNGTSDLFSFLTFEWWIAGLTLGFPVFGNKGDNNEIDKIMKAANRRLFWFYGVVISQLILVAVLYKI